MKRKGIKGWVEWTILHKKIVYLLVLSLAAFGIYGVSRINKDEFPSFDIKQGLVVGVYPGASAQEVEKELAKPLEETLFSYREVIRSTLRTVCRDGICYIYADLNCPQSRKDQVWSKIRLGLQAKKALLPPGVLAVAVLDDFSALSAIMLSIQSPDKGYSELQEIADRLCDRLRRLEKLSAVHSFGSRKEEIAVLVDMDRVSAYGINPASLLLDYQTAALAAPDGTFDAGYTAEPIHIDPSVTGEEEVSERIVYSDPLGNVIRLKDVARIERRYQAATESVSYNGIPAVVLSLEMRPENDIVEFGREVDRVLEEFSAELPQSVTVTKITDQPRVVKTSVFNFLRDLVIAMLVVVAVMLMLFPLKSALIASSGLPVITAMALCVMYVTGMELNTVSLGALITCLGMIVDDSIITMDGYMDKLGRKMNKMEAACASARELFMPTFIATLAISLMFFPIRIIITGYMGDFVQNFPWVILISLMLSLFYAVSVVPSLETRFIHAPHRGDENLVARIQQKLFSAIDRAYAWSQARCFRRPGVTMLIAACAVAMGVFMFSRLNIQMLPKAARDFFVVEVELESGNTLAQTKAVTDTLESILMADRRIVSVTSFAGCTVPRFSATYAPKIPLPTTAQMIVKTRSHKATETYLEDNETRLEHIIPKAMIRLKQMDYQVTEAPVMVTFRGEDRQALYPYADALRRYMNDEMPTQLRWVHSDNADVQPLVNITLDREEAARLGVNRALLSLQLAGSFSGIPLTKIWEDGRETPVTLYGAGAEDGMPYSIISDRMVSSAIPGIYIPLRQVADIAPGAAYAQIERLGGEPGVTVYGELLMGRSQPKAMKQVKAFVEKMNLPEGATVEYGGLSSLNSVMGPEIGLSFFVACLVLFLFLLFHFKKASIALLTMAMSTLCLFGAAFGMWIFNLDFGITAALGLISLVGIVVRNGILMYEYAEDKRARGMDLMEASMEAGKRRVRPIFLTSCTTALGVLPMIISGDLLWQPMGVIICFGTMMSIFLIVLVMPVSYYLSFRKS